MTAVISGGYAINILNFFYSLSVAPWAYFAHKKGRSFRLIHYLIISVFVMMLITQIPYFVLYSLDPTHSYAELKKYTNTLMACNNFSTIFCLLFNIVAFSLSTGYGLTRLANINTTIPGLKVNNLIFYTIVCSCTFGFNIFAFVCNNQFIISSSFVFYLFYIIYLVLYVITALLFVFDVFKSYYTYIAHFREIASSGTNVFSTPVYQKYLIQRNICIPTLVYIGCNVLYSALSFISAIAYAVYVISILAQWAVLGMILYMFNFNENESYFRDDPADDNDRSRIDYLILKGLDIKMVEVNGSSNISWTSDTLLPPEPIVDFHEFIKRFYGNKKDTTIATNQEELLPDNSIGETYYT
ncbi:hypothetical protein TRFO_29686 [Tritrichomonas foetus]|uniref:Uncharacterized protein n=1 Tax=Tritrichomonas foetus TaxID=1144522 RepID=A0A1J4K0K8_9EUKA|nr:hypothetical protein TRFO_29686 [Tritrichomonas foetus]|eukprot:OHT03029.1 hypothetical protein TRFO_29686 [Tritrichomonas foetus]